MRFRSFAVLLGAVLVTVLGDLRAADAQTVADVVWADAPLPEVLGDLTDKTGVEFVFALRLVRDVRVSGRYSPGGDVESAVRKMLRGTGVRAERIRAGQYVLIREPLNVAIGDEEPDAFTGTLEGRVVDASTDEPLVGAHVWLVDLALGDIVKADGSFAVPSLPTGEYAVRISHVGYRAADLRLDVFPDSPQLPPTIRLFSEPIASNPVNVGAGPEVVGPTPGTTDFGAQQAAAIPYALAEGDLVATLSWLPGLSRTGGASGALVVRGADPHQTRYVRDGVPLYGPWHAFGTFSAFQPEALARVRFHRGSLPAALGGGLAAVLDVETTSALAGDTSGTAAIGPIAARAIGDVVLSENVGLHVGLRHSTLGLLVAPQLREEGGAYVLDPMGGRFGSEPDLRFSDAEAKLSFRLGRHTRLDVGGTFGGDRVRTTLPQLAPEPGGQRAPTELDYRWRSHTVSARMQSLVGSRTFASATLYRTGHGGDEQRRANALARAEQTLVEHGATLDFDQFVSLERQVRGGVQIAQRRVDGSAVSGTRPAISSLQTGAEVAAYGMGTIRMGEIWEVQPGLRAELFVRDGQPSITAISPRVHARWSPRTDLNVRAGISRQTQAVQRLRGRVGDRYDIVAARWLLAGRDVPLASAWQVGVGAEWAISSPLAFSVDLYRRFSTGLLEPVERSRREPGVELADVLRGFAVHDGDAMGAELAARLRRDAWTFGLSGALAQAQVRPVRQPEAAWHPSRYDRPVVVGLLAERRGPRFSVAGRVDLESGLAREDGTRAPIEGRASLAVGARFHTAGLRWDVLAQATAWPSMTDGLAPPVVGTAGPLVSDPRGVPSLPLVSLSLSW
ncbi:MAG: TonB-dependent receptor [Bacteroidota bacterium]